MARRTYDALFSGKRKLRRMVSTPNPRTLETVGSALGTPLNNARLMGRNKDLKLYRLPKFFYGKGTGA